MCPVAGRQVSSASSGCDLETSRYSASSQDSLPKAAASDRTVNRESTGRIAAVSETSVQRNVSKSLSHKADMTTYGGEEGFTSGMDFTTCVGTLNPRLTDAGKGYSRSTVLWQADLLTKSLQSLGNSC